MSFVPVIDKEDIIFDSNDKFLKNGIWNGTKIKIRTFIFNKYIDFYNFNESVVRILSKLRHPNLVLLLGTFTEVLNTKLIINIIFDHSDGNYLENIIDYSQKGNCIFTKQQKNKISYDISKAVTYLHCLKPPIIHGAIEPKNIIISKNNSKLCDFNSLMEYNNEHEYVYLKPDERYCSPSYLLDKKELDLLNDIWSLGCTLCYLYTKKHPWYNQQFIFIIKNKMKNQIMPDSFELLEKFQYNILSQCVNYNLDERISSKKLMFFFMKQ